MTEPTPTAAARWMHRLVEDTSPAAPAESVESAGPKSGILALLGLLWLAAMVWSASASVAGSGSDPAVMISSAALAFPSIVAATLVAGAAAGLAVADRFSASRSGGVRRLLVGAAAGTACGLPGGGLILFAFGANAAIAALAVTVVAAGLVGGTAAGLLPPAPVAAGIAATLSVFVVGTLFSLFQSPLKAVLGAGATVASQTGAARSLLWAAALISGGVAGLVAYAYLRSRGGGLSWPWYQLAGATAGIFALAGEGLTWLGGAGLLAIVRDFSPDDRDIMNFLGSGRLVSALIVGFTGGIVAMIAIGRTLKRPEEPAEE